MSEGGRFSSVDFNLLEAKAGHLEVEKQIVTPSSKQHPTSVFIECAPWQLGHRIIVNQFLNHLLDTVTTEIEFSCPSDIGVLIVGDDCPRLLGPQPNNKTRYV